jgi:uncharacterized protein YjlB
MPQSSFEPCVQALEFKKAARHGAYPPAGTYDECTVIQDRPRALKTIPRVAVPRKDPVYGTGGPLSKLWKKAR